MIYQVLLASGIAGCLYRCGGVGHPFHTTWRDIGVPIVSLVLVWFLKVEIAWWVYLISFGLMYASMTTYHKWASRLFGFSGDDVEWPSWFMTGFVYGLTALPIAIVTGKWLGFAIRTVVLAFLTMLWSEWQEEVNLEEGGRGFLFTATLPLLLI